MKWRKAIYQIEFKVVVIRMFKGLSEKSNSMKKVIETMKNNRSEMKNAISEEQNTLEGTAWRPGKAKD